jgi:hypothetical protein
MTGKGTIYKKRLATHNILEIVKITTVFTALCGVLN